MDLSLFLQDLHDRYRKVAATPGATGGAEQNFRRCWRGLPWSYHLWYALYIRKGLPPLRSFCAEGSVATVRAIGPFL